MNDPRRPGRSVAVPVAALATAATMLVLDLTWLGVVAREFYNSELAPLRRPEVFLPAAGLFYALYLAAILVHAVLGASTPAGAARRGVALGLVAYGTYEFTNWAVLGGLSAQFSPIRRTVFTVDGAIGTTFSNELDTSGLVFPLGQALDWHVKTRAAYQLTDRAELGVDIGYQSFGFGPGVAGATCVTGCYQAGSTTAELTLTGGIAYRF